MAVKLSESEAILTEACGDVGCHDSEGPALDRSTYGLLVGAGVSTEIATYDVRAEVRYARGMADSYVHLYRDASVQSATLLVGLTF